MAAAVKTKNDASSSLNKAKQQKANTILWITYLNIVLYALCYQLQRPVEPFLIKSLVQKETSFNNNDDDESSSSSSVRRAYGNLQSFFQTAQTIGSPLVGILLDRLGVQKTSCLVFLASALSYAILAVANDLTTLFASKIPTILQAAFLVAQATATTTLQQQQRGGGEEEKGESNNNSSSSFEMAAARAAALGRMTTAYTIGATLGPTIGGYLANHGDYSIGAQLAVVGSLISVVLSFMFLPNDTSSKTSNKDNKNNNNKESSSTKKRGSLFEELKNSSKLLVRSGLWPLLMIKVLGGVIASMHSTAMPLVMTKEVGLEPSQLGVVMSSSMFAVAAFGAVAMAPLTKYLSTSGGGRIGMVELGLLLRAVMGCLLAWTVVSFSVESEEQSGAVVTRIIGVSICHALSSHTLATGLTTKTTGMVSKEEQGSLLGLEHGLFSLARIVGPTLGTRLLEIGGLWSVEICCGMVDITLAVLSVALLTSISKRRDKVT